jgi:hypothetical protein
VSFEDIMMKRLAECGTEACREVDRGLEAGRPLGDAVLDAIESLPAGKTRDLRRWLEDWEAWDEWLGFKKAGWDLRVLPKGIVLLRTPEISESFGISRNSPRPSERAIAASAGVREVKDAMGGWEQYEDKRGRVFYDRVYEVVS